MTRPAQLPLDLGHRPALGREDFLVAPANTDAVAWLDRWPRWPGPALVVYGPPGSGKTHLAHVWRAQAAAPLVNPAELDLATLPELIGITGAVAIDDAETVAGRRDRERAMLHLYNLATETGGYLLLLAGSAPAHWPLKLPDLRSRLNAAPVVAIEPPDDALLSALLVKLFADRQLHPDPEVIAYLVARMERSGDAACRVVATLDSTSLAARRPITVPLAREVLSAMA